MPHALIPPADYAFLGLPTVFLSALITLVGSVSLVYIVYKRLQPLMNAAPDNSRLTRIPERIVTLLKIWLAQYRQPRYMFAGILHIAIFFGFLILLVRTASLVVIGFWADFGIPGFNSGPYVVIKDYAATIVFIACVIAAIRRGIFTPERYKVPEKYGHDHTSEAVFVLAVISTLMLSESLYEASAIAAEAQKGLHAGFIAPGSLVWVFSALFAGAAVPTLQAIHVIAYIIHDIAFFFFACFLPFGKHFHVFTSVFNVFFMRLDKGNTKPVKYGIDDSKLDELESFGVKKLEDFTWKHLLDFYTCADCGRCSDQCPANAVGRPLSPRFITIKGRDTIFKTYPLLGQKKESGLLMEGVYEEDEIWSCTTCGACEQECPLGIEYIDKIVDLRRGMVDEGMVPQSLQKPMKALEKRGNPWGKMEKKRLDWANDKEFKAECDVLSLEDGEEADTLYFVDSISSYDERMQELSKATAKILTAAGVDFGVLGKLEKDSGNEVRRFGEEMLFQDLKAANTDAIKESKVKNIVTADPHAYNALKNDYKDLPPVEHLSQLVDRKIKEGKLGLQPLSDKDKVYTYHDPCYLGRHNAVYDEPRNALDAIPGMKRVDMTKSRDRSFCCGGGGLMLFYEPEEETRMGVLRVEMAKKAGANVIVTACPFCLVNMEDAIKVAGLEGEMEAIDFSELIARQLKS
ncbi:(Fe-S)-binding protein [bacterium]|nr:(Fe-S)-binding protein [bacterium]